MPSAKRAPAINRLLAALPEKNLEHLLASCGSIDLIFADVLCVPGDRIRHVYFPTDSFISLVAPIDDYAGLEVGMIGVSTLQASVHEGEARQVTPVYRRVGCPGWRTTRTRAGERLVTHD